VQGLPIGWGRLFGGWVVVSWIDRVVIGCAHGAIELTKIVMDGIGLLARVIVIHLTLIVVLIDIDIPITITVNIPAHTVNINVAFITTISITIVIIVADTIIVAATIRS
jgi:hypothetical protein